MDLTSDLAACIRADRMRAAEHERLVNAAKRAGRKHGSTRRFRTATGMGLIRAGLRLIDPDHAITATGEAT